MFTEQKRVEKLNEFMEYYIENNQLNAYFIQWGSKKILGIWKII